MDSSNHERVIDQEQIIGEGDDKISALPDSILHHILSYLPTAEVVVTSVLSKRWKHLWNSIPSLDFDDSSFDIWDPMDAMLFENSVNWVFLIRDKCSSLNSFRLSSRMHFSAKRVYHWIIAVIFHKVQELDLSLTAEQPFILPTCVFHNPKIRVLKLRMNAVLRLPRIISLSALEILHLCNVTFESDDVMQSLFSSCPSLTELVMLHCDWRNLRSILITMPSLKILAISDFSHSTLDNPQGCKIGIDARNIALFIYCGNLSNEINVHDISSSDVASLNIRIRDGNKEIFDHLVELFASLKNVSCFTVPEHTIEYLFFAYDVHPTVRNLKSLNLKGNFGKQAIKLSIKLLQFMPKLESLCVCEGLDQYEEDGELRVGPDFVLSSLKTVNYHNLLGTDAEICFLRFLLQNAIVLERMNIFWSSSFAPEPTKREVIKNLLHGVCRGSSLCVLTLT